MSLDLVFLGTVSAMPTRDRNMSSIALRRPDGSMWLFDCGEGTQHQIIRSDGKVRRGRMTHVFITHLHGDHLFGLPGLLCSFGASRADPEDGLVLHIYGPKGLGLYIRTSLNLSGSYLSYAYQVHELLLPSETRDADTELHACEAGQVVYLTANDNGIYTLPLGLTAKDAPTVHAAALTHRVTAFGYSYKEPPAPGSLDARALKEAGVPPGPLFGQLKQGKDVTLADGRVIKAQDFLSPPKPGRHWALLQDTEVPPPAAEKLVEGCDVLVHEATHLNDLKETAIEHGHSTSGMAGEFAARVKAKSLVLTHFSARYTEEEDYQKMISEANAAFAGTVTCAHDYYVHKIERLSSPGPVLNRE